MSVPTQEFEEMRETVQIGEYSLLSAGDDMSDGAECAVLDTNVVIDMEHFYFTQTSEEKRQSLKDLLLYLVKDRVEPSISIRDAEIIALASAWTERHSSYRSPRGICSFSRVQ